MNKNIKNMMLSAEANLRNQEVRQAFFMLKFIVSLYIATKPQKRGKFLHFFLQSSYHNIKLSLAAIM